MPAPTNGSNPKPIQISVSVSGICNSRCLYCRASDPRVPMNPPMQLSDLKRILSQAAELGTRIVTLTGGEPLLHPNIIEVVAHAAEVGLRPVLLTNGSLMTLDIARELHDAGVSALGWSLDSLDPDVYKRIRGIELAEIIEPFYELQTYRKDHDCIPYVVISFVLSTLSAPGVLGLIEKLRPWLHRMDGINIQPYQPPKDSQVEKDILRFKPEDEADLEVLIGKLLEAKRSGAPITTEEGFFKRMARYMARSEMPTGYSCPAGYYGAYITETMDMVPCWLLPPVGNLGQQSFEEIWFSQAYDDVRRRMVALDCPGCCLSCHCLEHYENVSRVLAHV